MAKLLGTIAGILLVAASGEAKTIRVPEDHATIAAAIGAASDGDTISLAPGKYPQSGTLKINKAVTVGSRFLQTNDHSDIKKTVITAAKSQMADWVIVSARNARVIGITFLGTSQHTVQITADPVSVLDCRFLGGKDQLSISGGGGHIARCYFENAGDDAIDCDYSVSWIIEHNTIVNAREDGIEVRLQNKGGPLTTHIFRYNIVAGSGQSGMQLIDYNGNSFREFFIHNNAFADCKGAGVSCMYREKDDTEEVYRGSLMMERAFVHNNTFDGCNYGVTLAPHMVVLNNIFVNIKTLGIGRSVYADSRDRSIVDYCLFFNNARHMDRSINQGAQNLIDVNPQVNAVREPLKGSPCIDAGLARYAWDGAVLTVSASDYRGKAPDLGALEYQTREKTGSGRATPLRRPTLWLLLDAVTLVMLIACVNIASLLLARAASHDRYSLLAVMILVLSSPL